MSQLKVRFFASLREQFGRDEIEISWQGGTPDKLLTQLRAELGENADEVLTKTEIMVAVNQTLVDADCNIAAGDEVALLPPVTGGY